MSIDTIKSNYYVFNNSDIGGNDIARVRNTTLEGCYNFCNERSDCYGFVVEGPTENPSATTTCNFKKKGEYWDTVKNKNNNYKAWVKKPRDDKKSLEDWIYPIFNIFKPEIIIQRRIIDFIYEEKTGPEKVSILSDRNQEVNSSYFNCPNCSCDDKTKIFLRDGWTSQPLSDGRVPISFDKYCVKLDDSKTCSIENFGGKCTECGYNGDWGHIIGNNNIDQGWINCTYSFDYTDFTFNDLSKFVKYIDTLYSDKVGMDISLKNRFRDSNYIYACILNFYSSIYRQYYYSGRNAINNFKNFDYLRNPIYQYKNSNIFSFINSQIQRHFTGGIVPSDLEHIVNDSLQLPIPNITPGNPGTYTINLNVPYDMYKEYIDKNQQARDTYISNLMEGFLRDTEGTIQDISTGNSWFSKRCDITSTDITMIYAVDVSTSTYNDTLSIYPDQYNDKDYLFLYCTITGTVNVWTPMLAVYFQVKATNGSENLDIITCNTIAEKAGYNSSDISLYPYICFQRLCSRLDKSQCINNMVNSCKLNYTPPAPFSRNINRYLTNKDSQQCQCYTSTLSPISESQAGNIAAMCFDKKCSDPELRQAFNLSDSNCKQYIDKVWNWIYSPNTQEKSRNSQTFDTAKFNRLAGKEYQPYQPASYNWQLLVIGIFTVVLLCLISFILCRKYDISIVFTITNLFVIILIFGGLTAFFCKDMAGLSSCDGKDFKCKSRYTDIELPNEFCNYTLNCECQFNEDCSPCSYCFSGTCAPENGTRKTITVSERKPNVVVLILSIILLVLLPTILIFLHDKKFLNIPSWIFNITVIIICLIPLGFIVYNSLKKVEFTKYDGLCTQECDDTCEGKTCGYNGCGQLCGTCQPGYECNGENNCENIF